MKTQLLREIRGEDSRARELEAALRALADALQDEIESSMGRELQARDLPKEWHAAQRLLRTSPAPEASIARTVVSGGRHPAEPEEPGPISRRVTYVPAPVVRRTHSG